MKILIAEDDEQLLRILEQTLTQAGHETTSVTSVAAGYQAVRKFWHELDLIVTDVQLPTRIDSRFPDGSGLDIARTALWEAEKETQPYIYIHSSSQSDHGTSLNDWVEDKWRTTFKQKDYDRQQTANNVLAFIDTLLEKSGG